MQLIRRHSDNQNSRGRIFSDGGGFWVASLGFRNGKTNLETASAARRVKRVRGAPTQGLPTERPRLTYNQTQSKCHSRQDGRVRGLTRSS
jgi:hypothetical protein